MTILAKIGNNEIPPVAEKLSLRVGLGLIEYMIERVYQVYLSFKPFDFAIVQKSEGWAPLENLWVDEK